MVMISAAIFAAQLNLSKFEEAPHKAVHSCTVSREVYGAPLLNRKEKIASFYGRWHQGRPMACGGTFNMYDPHVAAHKTLPCGTVVLVRDVKTGRSQEVTIRDRGPFPPGRDIDLSEGAFRRIAPLKQGLAHVELSVLSYGKGKKPKPTKGAS